MERNPYEEQRGHTGYCGLEQKCRGSPLRTCSRCLLLERRLSANQRHALGRRRRACVWRLDLLPMQLASRHPGVCLGSRQGFVTWGTNAGCLLARHGAGPPSTVRTERHCAEQWPAAKFAFRRSPNRLSRVVQRNGHGVATWHKAPASLPISTQAPAAFPGGAPTNEHRRQTRR